MTRVLIIDDDREFVESLFRSLGSNFQIEKVYSREEYEEVFYPYSFDVVLLDIRLSDKPEDKSGIDILKDIKSQDPDLPVLIMTAYGDIDIAVESLKLGAEDFIQKNKVGIDDYRMFINNLFRTGKLRRKLTNLESRLEKVAPYEIIGKNPEMEEVRRLINLVALDGNTNVLIRGETGTGKELVARAIHSQGVRKDNPFVAVALASLSEETILDDLFGHEKGAYTGVTSRRIGIIEKANGGILFLDEIGDLSFDIQTKLLRVLEAKEFTRMGGNKKFELDIQWVIATHRNLEEMIKKGGFREDLYYRLKAFEIRLPPLRNRKDDIPLLGEYFIKSLDVRTKGISDKSLKLLMQYDWPGNVRELKQTIQYAILKARLSGEDEIQPEHLPPDLVGRAQIEGRDLPVDIMKKIAEVELNYIGEALSKTGKKTEAYKLLGYSNRFALRRRVLTIFNKYPELINSFPEVKEAFTKR